MSDNSGKIILDLCGGTGAWSKPYREAGYDVRLITLPEHDVRLYAPPENVYGILASPPCTEFSLAKGNRPRDFISGMEVVEACMRIIWQCRRRNKLAFWAMENPVGFLRQFLGIPAYQFEQWQFGTPQVKRTDVWGYFNSPTPTTKTRPEDVTVGNRTHANAWRGSQKAPPGYEGKGLTIAAIRAITPPGFARAFYEANK